MMSLEYSLWNPGSMNPAACWLRSATQARASVHKQIVYSLLSLRQRQMAWAWGCLLAAHSSKVTAGDSGPQPTRLTVLCFHLRCQQLARVPHDRGFLSFCRRRRSIGTFLAQVPVEHSGTAGRDL